MGQEGTRSKLSNLWCNFARLGYSATRWNSLQMLMASLLRIRTAVRTFPVENMYDADFPEVLNDCNSIQFWNNLVRMEKLIRPLAGASFFMEGNNCSLAHCTHIHLLLFASYENEKEAQVEIETRWNNLEQAIFFRVLLFRLY